MPTGVFGWLFYFVRPSKHSMSKRNIERVFSKILSLKEQRHLRVAYYSHMILCIKEIILFSLLSRKHLRKRIVLLGQEHFYNAQAKQKGMIILTGHTGNWEFSPLFFHDLMGTNQSLYYCIRKSLRFEFLDRIFWERFKSAGFLIINKRDAIRQVRAAIKNQDVVFFPFDLKPKLNKTNLTANFLGQPSLTYSSAAYLANKYACPVLSITFYRVGKKQHVLEFYPEISCCAAENRKDNYLENTQRYNQRLEEMLLAHPEQWLWSYKRW